MSNKARARLSRILIGTGAGILILLLALEGLTYPWRLLFSDLGLAPVQTVEQLPEPPLLPRNLLVKELPQPDRDSPEQSEETVAEEATLIQPPAVTFVRPEIALVQLGKIKIPKISLSENVVAGTGDELHYAVGHMNSSPMPGQAGNCALAGHRNLLWAHAFRHLDKLGEGDEITLICGEDSFTYTVYAVFTVEPSENWVLALQPGETHMLTLITCTPALNPTHRLIVWARVNPPNA